MGFRIPFGTAVTLTPLRHPMEAVTHARSRGKPYDSLKAACADYLQQVRGFLTAERHAAPEAGRQASDLPVLGHPGVVAEMCGRCRSCARLECGP
ncbi:hypothetical protein [Streptomyces sp. NPDC088760]|uniref:hypothetical protein n=1 Tax=Streptomyces sp. NPDC088760 TaxID=3365890 RepID=UPI00380546F3